jgi:hypothetical protein
MNAVREYVERYSFPRIEADENRYQALTSGGGVYYDAGRHHSDPLVGDLLR